MKHSYPTTQIIQYIYHELEAPEHLETEYAIEHNPIWGESYTKLKSALSVLPKIQFFPKQKVVNRILEYSRS